MHKGLIVIGFLLYFILITMACNSLAISFVGGVPVETIPTPEFSLSYALDLLIFFGNLLSFNVPSFPPALSIIFIWAALIGFFVLMLS
jgi:hypothetical protein